MFVKHGDGKIVSVVKTSEEVEDNLTDEQKEALSSYKTKKAKDKSEKSGN